MRENILNFKYKKVRNHMFSISLVRLFIVVSIVILSTLIAGWNFNLKAKNPDKESDEIVNLKDKRLTVNDYHWSPIEVISEPIIYQNINTGNSANVSVAVENGKIYVVWDDDTMLNGAGGDHDIFYRYFNGATWSEIQVISEPIIGNNKNIGQSYAPDIAIENGKIYVVWHDMNNTNSAGTDTDIFYRCNFTGSSWEDIQVISEPVHGKNLNIGVSRFPAIAVDNNKIHLIWYDDNNTNGAGTDSDIFYRCNITGSNWGTVQVISEPEEGYDINIGSSTYPAIAVDNDKIYIIWGDGNNTNGAETDYDIFYRCNLTGSSWENIQVISEPVYGQDINTFLSIYPAITVSNNKVYVVWSDLNNTNGSGTDLDIFYSCNLTGMKWESVQVISEPVPGQDYNIKSSSAPEIMVENGKIYTVWKDSNNTNGAGTDSDIFYKCNLTGSGWEPVQVISEPIAGNDYNIFQSYGPNIAVYLGKCYIVWDDMNNTNGAGFDHDIFYRCTYLPLILTNPNVTPTSGNTSTYFNFTVKYTNVNNDAPTAIKAKINSINYSMTGTDSGDSNFLDGKWYYYNTTLDISENHTYQFWALDSKYTEFTAIFNNPDVYNTPPKITSGDNLTVFEDTYYEVVYKYEDIDIANVGQIGTWNFSTNASWLSFDNATAMLYGTPTNDVVGLYWVNITINDTIDMDFTNFTLTVININDNPVINTTNIEIIFEDELYEVDYNASDIDSIIENQIWSLTNNATSWLNIDPSSGIINGTPTNDDVGDYWVNVSVDDGDTGLAFTNFTLIVMNVNDRPEIITEDKLIAKANILYMVDYNATDIDSLLSQQTWLLDSNATWLDIDASTGVLSGTPTDADSGWFNVNVTVNDGDSGQDWNEFVLTVVTEGFENDPPEITTIDKVSITAGESYNNVYEATDDRTPVDSLIWSYNSNESWLSFNMISRSLSGNPTLSDVGWYWVNVTVGDGEGGFDSHNFTLAVYSTPNQPPRITTEDQHNAVVDVLYSVDYDAMDDRTSVDYLHWSLKTNASWLTMHMTTGVLSGTPESNDVGSYIVNISVFDGEDGWDFHNFVLIVSSEPIDENNAPELSDTTLTPSEGDVETEFTFSVHYYDEDADVPSLIKVFIDNGSYDMTLKEGEDPVDGIYTFSIKLSEGNHTYYFTASDGIDPVTTGTHSTPYINKLTEVDGDKTKSDTEIDWWIWVLIIVIIIVVVLVLLFLFILKKKPSEEPAEKERLAEGPLPTPGVEPEQPIVEEQPTEAPTPEQPQASEVSPEQIPTPESLQPEQPPPTPEVTPQVLQVEEQQVPRPQVEPQPQVEAQEPAIEPAKEPQGQAPVPKVKTQSTINEE